MGNALRCGGMGGRLAAAARDGDVGETRRLLAVDPGLARCTTTFGNLSSPLHLAAAKGHHEIATLLLENGADVNGRNIYGQTALMQACRSGHWEVVQTLLVFRCNVWKADNLSSRTALHMAAAGGHVRCVRLLLADAGTAGGSDNRARLVNKAGGGGVTALHLAALHGHPDCVHLLADERAGLEARTLPCAAAPMASIGAGSTPLHYAASGGEVKCCQILVSRGADRMAVNCNGWFAVDVARIWEKQWLEHVLSPKSLLPIPKFTPSAYLSLPLASLLDIARDYGGLVVSTAAAPSPDVDEDACAVCLERACTVAAEVCGHELCVKCAVDLCTVMKAYEVPALAGAIPCPLCRSGIASFLKAVNASAPPPTPPPPSLSCCSCKNCGVQQQQGHSPIASCRSFGSSDGDMDDPEGALPLYRAPFTASAILS